MQKNDKGGILLQYLKQVCLILGFSFLGEVCRALIPLPIPASIYGMVLLFAALSLKLLRPAQVKDAGGFLTSILPVLFVAPVVNLMDCWDQVRSAIAALAVIVAATTVITFGAAGLVTRLIMRGGRKHE